MTGARPPDRVRSAKAFLRRLPLFADLPESDLHRLCRLAERVRFPAGSVVMEEGSPGDGLYIVTAGDLEVVKRESGRDLVLARLGTGELLGEMSLLEHTPRSATVRAVTDAEALVIQPEAFREFIASSPDAAAAILRTMATRLRSTEASLMEQEKLVSLGTLAAGLAHELNNPAAAIGRAVSHMAETLAQWQRWTGRVGALDLSSEQADALRALQHALTDGDPATPRRHPAPDALERAVAEDRLTEWLEDRGVEAAWDVAPPLIARGWDAPRLDELTSAFLLDQLPAVLPWLAAGAATEDLLAEIETSAEQVSQIVKSVMSYVYLDQAPIQDVDVTETLENTLVILKHRLKEGVTVERDYAPDLPRIEAYGSELNQVWTNLIDNASDAMEGRGELRISAHNEDDEVVVTVADTGEGIPDDRIERIFDPFFTTKEPGKGTGLGLHTVHNIISRSGGSISVNSSASGTEFEVRLPTVTPSD